MRALPCSLLLIAESRQGHKQGLPHTCQIRFQPEIQSHPLDCISSGRTAHVLARCVHAGCTVTLPLAIVLSLCLLCCNSPDVFRTSCGVSDDQWRHRPGRCRSQIKWRIQQLASSCAGDRRFCRCDRCCCGFCSYSGQCSSCDPGPHPSSGHR
jgi:hypothetical protein